MPWRVRRLWNAVLDILFPPTGRCLLCGRSNHGPLAICSSCLQELAHSPGPVCTRCGHALSGQLPPPGASPGCLHCRGRNWAFSQARSIGPYDGLLRLAVHRLKFRGQQEFGRILAEVLYRSVEPAWWAEVDCIVPVPLHPERLRQRGFNQAEVIADGLATLTGRPQRRIMLRTLATQAQTGLSQRQRQRNVQGAFQLAAGQQRWVSGKRLLVVDDVLTTGSTLDACARVLRQAGAIEVRAATLAATDLRIREP